MASRVSMQFVLIRVIFNPHSLGLLHRHRDTHIADVPIVKTAQYSCDVLWELCGSSYTLGWTIHDAFPLVYSDGTQSGQSDIYL